MNLTALLLLFTPLLATSMPAPSSPAPENLPALYTGDIPDSFPTDKLGGVESWQRAVVVYAVETSPGGVGPIMSGGWALCAQGYRRVGRAWVAFDSRVMVGARLWQGRWQVMKQNEDKYGAVERYAPLGFVAGADDEIDFEVLLVFEMMRPGKLEELGLEEGEGKRVWVGKAVEELGKREVLTPFSG